MSSARTSHHGTDPKSGGASSVAPGDVLIRFEDVRKEFRNQTVAVTDLDLEVRKGELLVLVGPSGCGKSTTLRMVNRLVEPTGGRITLDGEDIMATDAVALRRRVGYVIQHVGLFPHRTVAQNVATVPGLVGWDRKRTKARVEELLALVGLAPETYSKRFPHELSGGERQRVGVARALAVDPPVLLMDEPFGAVDPEGRRRLQSEFRRIQSELGTTVMLVTHDIDEAVQLGDRVAVFSKGGVIEQIDTPLRLLSQPANDFVENFIGAGRSMRMLGLGHVSRDDLRPLEHVHPGATLASIPLGTSLDEAFAELAVSETGGVLVTDGSETVGLLTADDLLASLRRLVAEDHRDAIAG